MLAPPAFAELAVSIRTLTIQRRVRLLINEQPHSNYAPEFKLICGNTQIGAAWKAKSKSGQTYLAVHIDDPAWPNPIRASLFEHEGLAALCWTRRSGETDA